MYKKAETNYYHDRKSVPKKNSQIDQGEVLAIFKGKLSWSMILYFYHGIDTIICGHTDGIVHNIGDGKILVNLKVYPQKIEREMRRRLNDIFVVVDLKLSKYYENSWAYINMLQTRDIIIVPRTWITYRWRGFRTDKKVISFL